MPGVHYDSRYGKKESTVRGPTQAAIHGSAADDLPAAVGQAFREASPASDRRGQDCSRTIPLAVRSLATKEGCLGNVPRRAGCDTRRGDVSAHPQRANGSIDSAFSRRLFFAEFDRPLDIHWHDEAVWIKHPHDSMSLPQPKKPADSVDFGSKLRRLPGAKICFLNSPLRRFLCRLAASRSGHRCWTNHGADSWATRSRYSVKNGQRTDWMDCFRRGSIRQERRSNANTNNDHCQGRWQSCRWSISRGMCHDPT